LTGARRFQRRENVFQRQVHAGCPLLMMIVMMTQLRMLEVADDSRTVSRTALKMLESLSSRNYRPFLPVLPSDRQR
jgi:hypothetical protein